jgi:O-antigen/teichoic acid export membrane protein
VLLRHSFYYLFARGLPGLLSFAALMLYTRLLTAADFGRYAVVLAGVGLVHVMVFQWLQLVLARFLPAHRDAPHAVLQPILALFLLLAGLVSGVGFVLALLWPDPVWRLLIALAVPLTVAQAWLQIDLTLASTQLAPVRYGYLLGGKSLLALLLGGWLAWLGLGSQAPLIGLLVGTVIAWLLFGLGTWRGVRPRWPALLVLREYGAYGLPLVITFALYWVIESSDRLLIAWLLNEAATGVYAAGYDLAQQSLGLVLVVVNTAAYPLVVRQLEQNGEKAASAQLGRNGDLIVTLALAGAAGLIALAPVIVETVIGKAFRADAIAVVPWIAVAAAVAGIKAFHLDIAFQLARQSRWQAYTAILAAIANVVLNLILIPRYGILGAAWATLAACTLAALVSGWLGRRVFPMPAFLPLLGRGLAVAALAYLGAWLVMQMELGPLAILVLGIAAGGALALSGAVLLDVCGIKRIMLVRARALFPG